MQCAFCASGLLKKQRNLTAGEMVNQVMAVTKDTGIRVSHVVVMGTGEPFDNYDEVMKFVRIINHPHGLAIGARHITISTCGLVNMIERYSNEGIQTIGRLGKLKFDSTFLFLTRYKLQACLDIEYRCIFATLFCAPHEIH